MQDDIGLSRIIRVVQAKLWSALRADLFLRRGSIGGATAGVEKNRLQ